MSPFRTWPQRPFFATALLSLAVIAAYWNSLGGDFLYDDSAWVVNNPAIRKLWPLSDVVNPPANLGVNGRPLVSISFALSYALSGNRPLGYHAVNILIHVGASLALFALLRVTVRREPLRRWLGPSAETAAFVAALLWSLQPLNTIVVSYIAQRSESLMALFYLLTLYTFARGRETQRGGWLAASALCCLAGMCCKESMATAPLVVLLYDWAFFGSGFRAALRRHPRYFATLAATWILLGWLMIGLGKRGVGFESDITPWTYALTQTKAIVTYLRLAVWPSILVVDRGVGVFHSLLEAAPYLAVLLTIAGLVALAARGRRAVAFAGLAVAIILAPSSSFVPIVFQPIGENRAYLPAAIIISALVVAAFAQIGRRFVLGAGLIAAGFFTATVARNRTFRSEITLWSHMTALQPQNPRGHYNLGVALDRLGRTAEAMPLYAHTVELDPRYAKAHSNLGALQLQRGLRSEAIASSRRALELDPNSVEAHTNLATAYTQLERFDEAIAHYRHAVTLAPHLGVPHRLFGQTLLKAGRLDEAARELNSAIEIDPNDADALHSLGIAAYQLKDYATAARAFQAAVAQVPDSVPALNNFSAALLALGRYPDALTIAQRALKLQPENADVHFNVGSALLALRRFAEAAVSFEIAIRGNPQQAEAHNDLGVCLQQLGRMPEAIAAFAEALRLNPNYPQAANNLATARAALEKTRAP